MIWMGVMGVSVLGMRARGIRITVGHPTRVPDWVMRIRSRLPSHLILRVMGIRVA